MHYNTGGLHRVVRTVLTDIRRVEGEKGPFWVRTLDAWDDVGFCVSHTLYAAAAEALMMPAEKLEAEASDKKAEYDSAEEPKALEMARYIDDAFCGKGTAG